MGGGDLRTSLVALLPRLRRFGLALTGSAADADDLVQSACERVLARGEQLRDQARVDAWAYGIMRHLWIDEIRSRKVRRHDGLHGADNVEGESGVQVVEGRMTLDAVRRVLGGLPAEQRSVLTLVCVDGLSYKEAAEILQTPIGTVMSRLARGRHELSARLGQQGGGMAPQPIRQLRPSSRGA